VERIDRLVGELGLPERAGAVAKDILERAVENGLWFVENPDALAAATVYAACSQLGREITPQEVAETAGLPEWEVAKWLEELKRRLPVLDVPVRFGRRTTHNIERLADDIIPRGRFHETVRKAMDILAKVETSKRSKATIVAALCLAYEQSYGRFPWGMRLEEVAERTGLPPPLVRAEYARLKALLSGSRTEGL